MTQPAPEFRTKLRPLLWIIALSIAAVAGSTAQEITVAAAPDLQFEMQDISVRFQQQTGNTVKVVYGSSRNFFQQIQNGAPFDMFFSANLDFPKKLESAALRKQAPTIPAQEARSWCGFRMSRSSISTLA